MTTWTAYQEPTRNDAVAVGTSSVVISSARQAGEKRRSIIIRNTSPNAADTITINFGATTATANAGIILKQNESVTDSSETGYEAYQGVITAICATANGTLAIYER